MRAKQGGPDASFMPGLFGPSALGGGSGSIWRVDGVTCICLVAGGMK